MMNPFKRKPAYSVAEVRELEQGIADMIKAQDLLLQSERLYTKDNHVDWTAQVVDIGRSIHTANVHLQSVLRKITEVGK